jgi:SnoaL-like domain
MRKFSVESAIAALELKQMVCDYFHTLDMHGGIAAIEYFTEDVMVATGRVSYTGHSGMRKHYEGIKDRAATELQGGVRTGRHAPTNVRVIFQGSDRASITALVVTFSAGGTPPVENSTLPSAVSDVRFECRRAADGEWGIFEYYASPVFVGSDPFLIKSLIRG